ncbi:MAG: hypothetical protein ACI83B_001762 [Sediminicola sp.]|jgi:hypothetical protein
MLDFIISVGPIYVIEILAAIAGTYYVKSSPSLKSTRWLVIFLWVTVLVEFITAYPVIAHYSNYKYFSFVENTPYADNKWIFNIYIILNFTFFIYYCGSYIEGRVIRRFVKYSAILYVISALGYLLITDIYFIETSPFSVIAGTILLFAVIILFYFQLLKSDTIVNLKYFLPFYISIGVLIFNLCITPIDIFSEFYSKKNTLFWEFKNIAYLLLNLSMYSIFILGFIICRKGKSY